MGNNNACIKIYLFKPNLKSYEYKEESLKEKS